MPPRGRLGDPYAASDANSRHAVDEHPGDDADAKLDVLGARQLAPAAVDNIVPQLAQVVKPFELALVVRDSVDVEHCAKAPEQRRIVQAIDRLDDTFKQLALPGTLNAPFQPT